MQVFDLICELINFDPYCEIMIKDKSGDLTEFKRSDLSFNGVPQYDDEGNINLRKTKYKSSELYISINKEIED